MKITDDGYVVGLEALEQMESDPANTISDAKRLIGRNFTEKCVQDDIPLWPFEIE